MSLLLVGAAMVANGVSLITPVSGEMRARAANMPRFGSPVCTSRYLGLPDASGDALRCSCTPVAPGVRDLVENQINKNESMSNLAKQ